MTRPHSRAHSTNSPGSARRGGGDITQHGIPEDEPIAQFLNESHTAADRWGSILGNKQQKRQDSAREQPGLGIGSNPTSSNVRFDRIDNALRTTEERKNDAKQTRDRVLPWTLGRWLVLQQADRPAASRGV